MEYLLRKPKPAHTPIQIHDFNESSLTAFHPHTIVAVQNITAKGSTVIRMDPTANKGASIPANTTKKAILELASRDIKRNRSREVIAEHKGEKNLTPNIVSPHKCVPSHWT